MYPLFSFGFHHCSTITPSPTCHSIHLEGEVPGEPEKELTDTPSHPEPTPIYKVTLSGWAPPPRRPALDYTASDACLKDVQSKLFKTI